ncbi:MAG: hypothetical protein MnENMB40S_08910 [Rhizobiaceae bacterium MnEN-MB40S]|nr:MAG: hypothetical protein MnENMB40S_08910 [Rhizobiaceae bacterium MnEN-MB40S]
MRPFHRLLLSVAGFLLLAASASAADITPASEPAPADELVHRGIVFGKNSDYWEVRLGGGVYDWGPATPSDFSGGVVNAEILAPTFDVLSFIGSPRVYLGTDIAISDDAIHTVYAGLNWQAYFTPKLYIGFSGGGAWVSSQITTSANGVTKDLGSEYLFHLQASVGYDITSDVTMEIFYNHFSNANLAYTNPGLESVGARIGYRF